MLAKFIKSRKEYECFECSSKILKGDMYTKQSRGNSYSQSVGHYKNSIISEKYPICKKCTESEIYTDWEVKTYPESFEGCVKFGYKYKGYKWNKVDENYLIYCFYELKNNRYYHEISTEFKRRKIVLNPWDKYIIKETLSSKYLTDLLGLDKPILHFFFSSYKIHYSTTWDKEKYDSYHKMNQNSYHDESEDNYNSVSLDKISRLIKENH